jgi:hypothetical protein
MCMNIHVYYIMYIYTYCVRSECILALARPPFIKRERAQEAAERNFKAELLLDQALSYQCMRP